MELKVKDKSKLFDETYWFLCEQYRRANPLHFILLVGMDDELSYGMANYILGHRYQNGYLRCIDYPSETDIVEHVSQMRFGTVLLLRGLEKASQVALIPIIRKIESVIYNHNEKPKPLVIEGETVPCDEFGTLIINTSNPNIIPEYIKRYFEVISIEPEIPTNTPQTTPGTKGNVFHCVGDMWQITLRDDHLQVKNNRYMKHIKYVLENPQKKLFLLELDRFFEQKPTKTTKEQQGECMDILGVLGNSAKIDNRDNQDSKGYLNEKIKEFKDIVEIAKETGNSELEAKSQAELDELLEHLSSGEYKIRTSSRKGRDEASILKGINRCIDSIKDASSKAKTGKLIAEHIDKNIERSNYHIIYKPENNPNWNL